MAYSEDAVVAIDVPLDVEDELVLGFAEDEDADGEHDDRPGGAEGEDLGRGALVPQEDVAHEGHEAVHGVRLDDADDPKGGTLVDEQLEVPEQGREVGPRGEDDAPQVDDVAEEHGERADDEADADAEDDEETQAHGQPDKVPGGHDAEPQHDERDGDEREGEVHEREQDLLHREHEARDLDLFEQRGGVEERRERGAGRVGHERECDVAQDEVEREVLDAVAEQEREHDAHDNHHEQRVQHRPNDAQHAAAVFELEVLGDELLQDKAVLLCFVLGIRLDGSRVGRIVGHEQCS